MTLWQRMQRKVLHIWRRDFLDGVLAEWLSPVLMPRVFPSQQRMLPQPLAVRSVLVWNVDSFGDFLFVTPLLRALRQGYPQARIDLVLNKACIPLAETNPNIDRLIPVSAQDYYNGSGLLRLPAELRGASYDVGVIAEMGSRPADAARVVMRRLAVRYIVSSNLGLLKSLPDFTLPPNQSTYWPDYFLKLAEHLNLPLSSSRPEVYLTSADQEQAEAVLGIRGTERMVALHPMVASYALTTKKWPDASFEDLAEQLARTAKTRFLLTGSSEESRHCEAMAARMTRRGLDVQSVAGRLSLRGTVALYQLVDLLVTGDTAALHLGAAAQVPIVAIFGATDERRLTTQDMIVHAVELPCRPCHKMADRNPTWPICRYDRPWCLTEISVDRVVQSIGPKSA